MSEKTTYNDADKFNDILDLMLQMDKKISLTVKNIAEQNEKPSTLNGLLQNMAPFSENTEIIDEALSKAQAKFTDVVKSNTAGKGNFTFKHANLADIKEAVKLGLTENNISVTQPWEYHTETSIYLATVLRCKGQWIKSGSVIDLNDLYQGDKKPEQDIGARITYFRKYQIQSILFLYGKDTDDLQKQGE